MMLCGSQTVAFSRPCPARRSAGRQCVQPVRAVVDTRIHLPFQKDAEHLAQWSPKSWKGRTAHQQPNYPDRARLEAAVETIARMPPLVFAGECRTLQARLAKCATGEAFLLQGARPRGTLAVIRRRCQLQRRSASVLPPELRSAAH